MLYNRKKARYRKDGYCWKKRRDGKTTREDHMKLKVQGIECIYWLLPYTRPYCQRFTDDATGSYRSHYYYTHTLLLHALLLHTHTTTTRTHYYYTHYYH